ncbi:MAG: MlaD family protein [Bacteroidota bacterium]|nr:MlaD family protein [Bacteroidota bacterium]
MKKTAKIVLGSVATIGILLFAFLYTKGSTVLNKEKKLKAYFTNVEGLIESTPLLLKGFPVGKISEIELNGDSAGYQVMVTFLMTTDIRIPEKSGVKIISSDLLGTKAVELIMSEEVNQMAENEILIGFTEESFKDKINKEIAPIRTKADSLIASVDSAMSIFKEIKASSLQKNVIASFESIKKSIIVLKQTSGKVDTIVGYDNSAIKLILTKVNSISSNLTKNADALLRITENYDKIVDAEAKNMVSKTMNEVNKAIADAGNATAYVNSGKGTIGKAIKTKAVQDNLDKANKALNLLLKEALANPDRFIHVSIFAPKKTPIKADSLQ